jgi:hypothetical protein
MTQVLTRSQCGWVRWSQRGISFESFGNEDEFILGQRVLFEGKDYLVVECWFDRVGIGVVHWHVELQ